MGMMGAACSDPCASAPTPDTGDTVPTDWTPAALSDDIPAASAAPGQLGPHDLAIWRSASGRIAAWADRCPHRGMRLSHGFVRGERLSCIYHGWGYGEGGRCVRIPAHPELTPPEAIRVPVFSVAEASGVIWVAEEAPDSPPPEFPGVAAFRSLQVSAAPEALATALGGTGTVIETVLGGAQVVALVQPLRGGAAGLHLLAPEGSDPAALDALSAEVEALRRRLEAAEEMTA